jgi:RYK receptor-like tyrosine kinase
LFKYSFIAGLSAELYYVRDGHINDYALHFTVPVPANVKDIAFTWQSLAGRPLPYRINITTSDPAVLPRPPMNVSSIGEIPLQIQTFEINLRCSGIRAAEVDVVIIMEVILNRATNNVTELIFKRKKVCLESEINETTTDDIMLLEHIEKSPSAMITLAIGCILALVLVAILISIAYCAKAPTKRPLSQPVRTSSFQRLATHSSSFTPSSFTPTSFTPSFTPSFGPSLAPSIYPTIATLQRSKSADTEELHRKISEITVQRCRVRLSSLLLEGSFGRLYRGSYNENQDVLVKTVNPHASQMQVSMLLQEGMRLYGASHINILSVFGVSIEDHTAPILMYSGDNNMRNLKQFLHEPVARTLTTIQIVKMSLQLASAVGHLHTHGVLHNDVAARNCV